MISKKEYNKLKGYMSLEQYKMKTIINKQDELIENNDAFIQGNSEYLKRRYLIAKEINQINKVFEIMNLENIHSYNDIDDSIYKYEEQIIDLKTEYEKLKIQNRQFQKILPVIQIYIKTFYFKDLINKCSPADMKELKKTYAKEIRLFQEAEKEIMQNYENVSSIDDAKKLMVDANRLKAKTNEQLIKINNVIKRINDLNYIKSFKYRQEIDKLNRILSKGFYVNKDQIINSNDKKTLVKLPNKNLYIEVDNEAVAWINYDKRAYIYIIEDENYKVYDKEQEKYADNIKGTDIDSYLDKNDDLTIDYNF